MTKNAAFLTLLAPFFAYSQGLPPPSGIGPPTGAQQQKSAQAAAPVDFTGYWVSVVTEDWRWRMVTPIHGDFASIPLNNEGRRIGNAWDPAKDTAAGEQCKAYGAPAIMRIPGRLHFTWADDNTLKIETDAGEQTRLLHFTGKPAGSKTWQGYSAANWERPVRGSGTPGFGLGATREGSHGKSLEVVTTDLRAGYLRKNGPPYSENTVLHEYYDLHKEPNGDTWFTVTTIVEDPTYLTEPFVTSTDFKKIPDGAGWSPSPCTAK
ncbi:MAG TPA: hypothetical protein VFW44_08095 [Bryobacteraceae bacterium]|nr:hypothetical protein [Bryobacteraceae bacterium]